MRDLNSVILELLAVIPIDEIDLRQALEAWLDIHNLTDNPESWNEVGDILYNYVFSDFYPEIGWQAEVEKIWTGDEDSDLLDFSNF